MDAMAHLADVLPALDKTLVDAFLKPLVEAKRHERHQRRDKSQNSQTSTQVIPYSQRVDGHAFTHLGIAHHSRIMNQRNAFKIGQQAHKEKYRHEDENRVDNSPVTALQAIEAYRKEQRDERREGI